MSERVDTIEIAVLSRVRSLGCPPRAIATRARRKKRGSLGGVSLRLDTSTEFGARVERRLRDEEVVWLVTTNRDGSPEPSPVWFIWDGDTFLIYSRAGTARERNIRRNPLVSLHFDSGTNGENVVVVAGEATLPRGEPPPYEHAEYLAKYREGLSRLGMTPEQFAEGYPLVVRVRPTRLRGF
jgi:PPOX class probable F420-dependent enzyme